MKWCTTLWRIGRVFQNSRRRLVDGLYGALGFFDAVDSFLEQVGLFAFLPFLGSVVPVVFHFLLNRLQGFECKLDEGLPSCLAWDRGDWSVSGNVLGAQVGDSASVTAIVCRSPDTAK